MFVFEIPDQKYDDNDDKYNKNKNRHHYSGYKSHVNFLLRGNFALLQSCCYLCCCRNYI